MKVHLKTSFRSRNPGCCLCQLHKIKIAPNYFEAIERKLNDGYVNSTVEPFVPKT